jgi:two-component system, NarL family, response regulator DegU
MEVIKLMIADDQLLFLEGISTVVESMTGIKLTGTASNGKELIEKIKIEQPDVVLLDLKMPVMDGLDTLTFLKSHYPTIKVIILTMHDEDEFIIELIENGANSYLLKNTGMKEVERVIKQVMENDYCYNEHVQKVIAKRIVKKSITKGINAATHGLTDIELEILQLICAEMNNEEIGNKMFLSPRTIEGHKKRLQKKFGVKSVVGLAIYAIQHKLLEEE